MNILDFLRQLSGQQDNQPWGEKPSFDASPYLGDGSAAASDAADPAASPVGAMPGSQPTLPPIPQPPRQPTGVRGALLGALQDGLAGAATENTAGGGGHDILRAMAAGQYSGRQRSLVDYGMQRKAAEDEVTRQKAEADIDEKRAFAEYRRKLAEREKNAYKTVTTKDGRAFTIGPDGTVEEISTPKTLKQRIQERIDAGYSPEEARYAEAQGHVAPKPDKPSMVEVDEATGKQYGLVPDAQGKYHIPVQSVGANIRAATTEPKPESQDVSHWIAQRVDAEFPNAPPAVKAAKRIEYMRRYQLETNPQRSERPAGPDTPKKGTPGQFSGITEQKRAQMATAEEKARKRIQDAKEGKTSEDEERIYSELRDEKQRIQDSFEEKNRNLGGEPEHFEYPAYTPGAAKSDHPSTKGAGATPKVFPRARLAGYATANGVTPQQAEAALKSQGYAIQ